MDGIVLNFSAAIIRNNIIAGNFGGQDFGGSGIWAYGNGPDRKIIENNTIINNYSASSGGGFWIMSTTVHATNNIIYNNSARTAAQISGSGIFSYCNIQGGRSGEGNIDAAPGFSDYSYTLPDGNACIDGGNQHASYNDPEDPDNPGSALAPAQGSLINDIGAHGGPGSMPFPVVDLSDVEWFEMESLEFSIYPIPAEEYLTLLLNQSHTQDISIKLFNLAGQEVTSTILQTGETSRKIDLKSSNIPVGVYIMELADSLRLLGQRKIIIR